MVASFVQLLVDIKERRQLESPQGFGNFQMSTSINLKWDFRIVMNERQTFRWQLHLISSCQNWFQNFLGHSSADHWSHQQMDWHCWCWCWMSRHCSSGWTGPPASSCQNWLLSFLHYRSVDQRNFQSHQMEVMEKPTASLGGWGSCKQHTITKHRQQKLRLFYFNWISGNQQHCQSTTTIIWQFVTETF